RLPVLGAERQRARVAARDVGEPQRGAVLVRVDVDVDARERDALAVGRDLRIGDPHVAEQIVFGHGPGRGRRGCGLDTSRTHRFASSPVGTGGILPHAVNHGSISMSMRPDFTAASLIMSPRAVLLSVPNTHTPW